MMMAFERLRVAKRALETIPENYRPVTAEEIVERTHGHGFRNGMHVGWRWEDDNPRGPALAFLSEHRHPGMSAERFFLDGSSEWIPTPGGGHMITGDPVKDAEIEREFFASNKRAYANLRQLGLLPPAGQNIGSQEINEFLLSGGMAEADGAAKDPVSPRITIVQGDITRVRADAIVNAANHRMRGGGGVDGAIHRAGGPSILKDCIRRFPDGLRTGDAGWTTAGNLPAQWVIHAVGPNQNAGEDDPDLLASCYRRALEVADELGAKSVAVPLIGAGAFGWTLDEAARIALQTLSTTDTRVAEIAVVAFGAEAEISLLTERNGRL